MIYNKILLRNLHIKFNIGINILFNKLNSWQYIITTYDIIRKSKTIRQKLITII